MIVSGLVLISVACRPRDNSYERFVDLPAEGWRYGDTLKFDISHRDSIISGSLKLHLRHTGSYPYRNLWLELVTSDSTYTQIDTLNVALSDVFGKWYGRGVGTDFQLSVPLTDTFSISAPTSVVVRHIMRVDNLPGIEQIGLQFEEIENE